MIGTMLEAHHDLCLVREPEWITISIKCDECDGRGFAEYERITRRFFDPFQTEERLCRKCQGACEVEIEICAKCKREEMSCRCEAA